MHASGKKGASIRSASAQFPGKFHDLMTYTERQGLDHIISWIQNGRAIMVHKPEALLEILPLFGFSQTKYRSFQRQLNMWHFQRILDGPYKGGWIHPHFTKGNKALCIYMSRALSSNQIIPTRPIDSHTKPTPVNERVVPSNKQNRDSSALFAASHQNISSDKNNKAMMFAQFSGSQNTSKKTAFPTSIIEQKITESNSSQIERAASSSPELDHLLEPLNAETIDSIF